jgi:hypothetical protein
MATSYFSNFPSISYNLPLLPNLVQATDVTRRFILRDFYKRNLLSFFTYDIADGERPDLVAFALYGDSMLDWLILLPNEILDPYYQWPLSTNQLNDYIRKKYGSISAAMAEIHRYEQIIRQRTTYTNNDGETIIIPEHSLIVDQTTYTSLSPSSRRLISKFDHETTLNDKRRNISIIDPNQAPGIIELFRNLYR